MRQVQANLTSPSVGKGGLHRLQSEPTPNRKQIKKNGATTDIGYRDAFGSSGRNRKNIPSQSHLGLHPHIVSYSVLPRGHDARDGYIGDIYICIYIYIFVTSDCQG
jgi:hypothetical protein